jgi:hypothetical protein
VLCFTGIGLQKMQAGKAVQQLAQKCAQMAALPPQRSSTAPQLRPGQRSPGGGGESRGQPAFRVTDYAPDWDSTSGGAKLLLTGSLLAGAPPAAQRGPLYLLFDQTEVPTVSHSIRLRCPHPT